MCRQHHRSLGRESYLVLQGKIMILFFFLREAFLLCLGPLSTARGNTEKNHFMDALSNLLLPCGVIFTARTVLLANWRHIECPKEGLMNNEDCSACHHMFLHKCDLFTVKIEEMHVGQRARALVKSPHSVSHVNIVKRCKECSAWTLKPDVTVAQSLFRDPWEMSTTFHNALHLFSVMSGSYNLATKWIQPQ